MALLLDTCVLSELVRRTPHPAVVAWFDEFGASCLLSSPVVMELQAGLPPSKGSQPSAMLERKLDRLLKRFPRDRRLVFDEAAASEAAAVLNEARRTGRPIGIVDAQIVGLALSIRCAVATRDGDFNNRGVTLVDPWSE